MALSHFTDRGGPPDEPALFQALGEAAPLWAELIGWVRSHRDRLREEWGYPGAKFGWSLRLKEGERNLVYLTPGRGEFLVGVVVGERAVAAARERGLSVTAAAVLDAAPRHAEGRGCRLAVRGPEELRLARELVGVKLEV